jgi:hypothetical protein
MTRYDADFHQWIDEQTAALKAGRFDRLDVTLKSPFPKSCAYGIEQILDEDFWPAD